jgi:hypothetical protein
MKTETKTFEANLCVHEGKPIDPETPEGRKVWNAGLHEDVDVVVHAEYTPPEPADHTCDASGDYVEIQKVVRKSDGVEIEDAPEGVLKSYEEQARED